MQFSNSKQSNYTVGTPYFDLHFEIGANPPPMGGFYALTILGNNGIKFEAQGASPAHAIAKIVADMESSGIWQIIVSNPGMTPYPFSAPAASSSKTANTAPTVPSSNKKQDPPKQLPSALAGTKYPDCQAVCTSFEHFGEKKCSSMCAGKVRPATGALSKSQRR